MTCPICKSTVSRPLHRLYDDRYGYPDEVDIVQCSDCGHKFSVFPLEADAIAHLYTDYYQRNTFNPEDFRPYREPNRLLGWLNGDYSSAARWVSEGTRVLDIGCGLGWNVAYHAERGCDAYGVDADQNVKIIAEKFGLKIEAGIFDAQNYSAGFFDYVTLDQVIEHVSDPHEMLRGVHRVLKAGGRCVISTPNANGWGTRVFGKRWLNWHIPFHQQFYSESSVRLLAKKNDFVVERISTITRSAWMIYQIAHLLTYPRIGSSSIFWAPRTHRLGWHQTLLLKFIMATRLTLVPQVVTRFFDALGVGDNYLIVLKKIDIEPALSQPI